MPISLRGRVFAAFVLVAGAMGALTVVAVRVIQTQHGAAVLAGERQDRIVDALAHLRAAPFEAEGLVMNHLHAHAPDGKQGFAADLMGVDTREALALSTLADLALGPERALVADLKLQAAQAADLRDRILAVSERDALGRARTLATQEMPGLRAELVAALRAVGVQGGQTLAAARAEAAVNAIAAAQKNAILMPEPDYVAAQLAALTEAQAELAAALAALQSVPAPGLAALQGLVDALQALDGQMAALLADSGYDTAEAIYASQLRPLDEARLARLDSFDALMQTGRRMADAAALARVESWQTTLIYAADAALVLGFLVMMQALSRLGRGLEGAVQLAERMSRSEFKQITWVERSLAGRLTAALVQISAGQSAVLASLESVAAGRPLRQDLPDRLRERMGAVAALISPETAERGAGLARARAAAITLQETLREAQRDGEALRDGAEAVVVALGPEPSGLSDMATRQVLIGERHLATLILAEREAGEVVDGLGAGLAAGRSGAVPAPSSGLRRIA